MGHGQSRCQLPWFALVDQSMLIGIADFFICRICVLTHRLCAVFLQLSHRQFRCSAQSSSTMESKFNTLFILTVDCWLLVLFRQMADGPSPLVYTCSHPMASHIVPLRRLVTAVHLH